jgi:hypothetical protein
VAGELGKFESVLDTAGVAPIIELLLPAGGRPRQLSVRTLFLGMLLSHADGRPAHLTRVHRALISLTVGDRCRLGIEVDWSRGPHLLTYRQVERTFSLVVAAMTKPAPDGEPGEALSALCDALMEASVPDLWKEATGSLAVDWSDLDAFACPPPEKGGPCADDEASWGRRASDAPGVKDELFFGYELQSATMVNEEGGELVPELTRRLLVTSCHIDPPHAFVGVLQRMVASGHAISDVLADSGYAHRVAEHWALPLRALGAAIVTDLHPHDRGPRGTFAGAVIADGNLYCPMTPPALFELGPLARGATRTDTDAHDQRTAERSRYKLGRITSDDQDGYHRVACPAVMGKLRCPLREGSMLASHRRPEILTPPEEHPRCCTSQTVTVPPETTAKTAQKHDYPSKAHRTSYARRTAVERTFSTVKNPATNDISKGWCRMSGLAAMTLFMATLFVVRNDRVVRAFETRQSEDARRDAAGLPPKTRRRRRTTLIDLVGSSPP